MTNHTKPYWWTIIPVGATIVAYDEQYNAIFVGPDGTRWKVDPWDDTATEIPA